MDFGADKNSLQLPLFRRDEITWKGQEGFDIEGVKEINYGDISPQPEIRAAAGSIQVQRSWKKCPHNLFHFLDFSSSLFWWKSYLTLNILYQQIGQLNRDIRQGFLLLSLSVEYHGSLGENFLFLCWEILKLLSTSFSHISWLSEKSFARPYPC